MADPQDPRQTELPTVLLIDDEPLILDAFGQGLQDSFKLFTAGSAAEADLRLAARKFDAIVCDQVLPGEQGLDFLTRISESSPTTKRILMTGYSDDNFISRSTATAGLSACLIKPVKASQIAAAIRAALAS